MPKKLNELRFSVKRIEAEESIQKREQLIDELLNDINADLFAGAIKDRAEFGMASPEEKEVYAGICAGLGDDFGFLLPPDIKTKVNSLRGEGLNLQDLITVEPVTRDEGSRVFDLTADIDPLDSVESGEDIPVVDPSKLIEAKYKLKRKAGIVRVSTELFLDSNKVLINWIIAWSAKKSRATRNKMIMDQLIDMAASIGAAGVSEFRDAILTGLSDQYKGTATVLVNYAGYDYLDSLVDENGEKILKDKLLFALYPVTVLPDNLLANEIGEITVMIGSLKEAAALFDRGKMLIDVNKTNGFFEEYVSVKLIEKIDVKSIDKDAVIKVSLSK